MSDIRKFQITTGHTVIGKMVEESSDRWVVLEHPLGVQVVQTGQDQFGLKLVPFDPSNPEGRTKFYQSQIVSEALDVPEGLVNAYIQQTSSIQIISALDQMEGLRK